MKTVVAGALGECVHVAGVTSFLRLAEIAGWRTVFLGPAVSVERFVEAIKEGNADLVGVSYRLTPETGERLLGEFAEAASDLHESGVRFVFGAPLRSPARRSPGDIFEKFFDVQPADGRSSGLLFCAVKVMRMVNP
jgi:methylmalonyl-CoA mutase cobalamin-binding subunit